MAISLTKPTVGGSENTWGATINTGLDAIADALNGTAGTVAPNLSTLTLNGTDVTATAAELNKLDGVTASTTELNKLDGVTASTTALNRASTHYVPSGGIIMWSGAVSAIPTGWVLCNGSNGTPNLRNRFVVGAGSTYDVDDTGGAATVTLSTANLPAHTHSSGTLGGTTNTTGAHTHSYTKSYIAGSADGGNLSRVMPQSATTGSAGDHSHTVDVNSGSTGSAGSGTAINIVPKYFALAYIMKT